MMNSQTIAQNRYTCKAYDNTGEIPHDILQRLLEVLRLSPSAINIQAWKFLVAQTDEAKQKLAQATVDGNAHNAPKILNSSVAIVLAGQNEIDDQHLHDVMNCEAQAGRFATTEAQQQRTQHCFNYMQQKRALPPHEMKAWIDNQVYIALGSLLTSAEIEGIQATPIEGFDSKILDQVLDLSSQNLHSRVIVALGYASDDDFNRKLPKGRLSAEQVIQYL